ncbi:chromosome (plasmid) partitioning protein ParB [Gracilibacillus boraciitolerans JCM 21714]|uniref:Chromosome (Plasmid) partitioning protein ParB n=1 Tax=Gracilibacillus boraciitolerans JCM 21714 TaxID=1298598 RepID=W4VKD0_9BACI|nr:nucleoid occlusion protein [Gracilibacillus boraciitolerans]GAE93845.1 chromosome (plasmid) partitioning protein ParB [Gracilibacillus boraciitolerans JCM 21714]
MLHPFGRIFGIGDKAEENIIEDTNSLQDEVVFINIDAIEANRFQPRSIFNEEKIKELAQTLHTHGLIQPIVVRRIENATDKYEIIAGERRWRAAKSLNWDKVPAIIREMTDKETASVALIENLQREELTVIEEAAAYEKLIQLHELTQEALAQRLGKNQSTIANKMRLLKLPEEVQQAILKKQITERHGRALIILKNEELQLKVLNQIIERDLNVKQTEAQIERLMTDKKKPKKPRQKGINKDMRIAMNTIRQSLDMVSDAGIDLETDEQDHEDFYQITIKISKKK